MVSGGFRVNPEVLKAFREISSEGVSSTPAGEAKVEKRDMAPDERAEFRGKFGKTGTLRAGIFGKPALKGDRVDAMFRRLATENPSDFDGALFALVLRSGMEGKGAKSWRREEVVGLFEKLIECGSPIVSHPKFRGQLSRDENLFANQLIREANGNIAYRSVDFDLVDENGIQKMPDDEFWARMDGSLYKEDIENNAVYAMLSMAEKLGIVS